MSDPALSVAVETAADAATRSALHAGLFEANVQATGDGHFDAVCVTARDAHGTVVGGVMGEAYWGWVNFTTVWVHPDHRRKGLARQMLQAAEVEALRLGYTQAYLDTFSFQSPALYLRCGYEVFGQLEDFPPGRQRFFLRKQLHAQVE